MTSLPLWRNAGFLLVPVLLACTEFGCARPLPRYPAMSPADAAQTIAARLASVRTLSARCEITMTDAQKNAVRLDGALAAAEPDCLRLRAWKFDQAVFDLTLTPEGLWLFSGDDAVNTNDRRHLPRAFSAAQIGRAWLIFTGGFFLGHPSSIQLEHGRRVFAFTSTAADGMRISCMVDRSTLTPSRYDLEDSAGMDLYSLQLSRYQTVNGIPWPTQIDFQSRDGELSLRLDDIEINGALPESAFVPPRRAVRQP